MKPRALFLVACLFVASCGSGGSGAPQPVSPSGEAVGQVEPDFGGGFATLAAGPVADIALLDDGTLLVAGGNSIAFPRGPSDAYVLKMGANGQPDASFNTVVGVSTDGKRHSTDRIRALGANELVLVETRRPICTAPDPLCPSKEFGDLLASRRDLVRGRPDTVYGIGGQATLARSEGAVVVAQDGRVTSFTPRLDVTNNRALLKVASLDPFGHEDAAFEARANASLNCDTAQEPGGLPAFAAAAMAGDRYIVAAQMWPTGLFCVTRLNADGSLDATFGSAGHQVFRPGAALWPSPSKLLIRDDGEIVVLLSQPPNQQPAMPSVLLFLSPNGAKDRTVEAPPFGLAWIGDLAVQSNGKLVAAGLPAADSASEARVVRLSSDGTTVDTTFGNGGSLSLVTPFGPLTVQKLAVLRDGRIVLGGFTPDGSGMLMRLR